MQERKVRLVSDSSCDIYTLDGRGDFYVAPLKIITESKEYVDEKGLDVKAMASELSKLKTKSSTSCPNVSDWLDRFGDADEVYCVTITSTLSGSYNSAINAKKEYESKDPGRRVAVIDSLSTGPEIVLILKKIDELLRADKTFDEINETVCDYTGRTGLIFMLRSMINLANNGRVSHVVAKMAGILGICIVGKASDVGDLQPLAKTRGERKTVESIFEQMKKNGYSGGRVSIAHCQNETAAKNLDSILRASYPNVETEIHETGGLCTYYAEVGGLLVGFEK